MAAVLTFNQFLNSTIGLNDAEKVLKYIENGLDDFGSMAELDDSREISRKDKLQQVAIGNVIRLLKLGRSIIVGLYLSYVTVK